jgi:AcrR family transcriptional regulator
MPDKQLRADARRNYERLLEAAREAVAEHGIEASLDDIAKRAKVGSGTLYRHFPNRLALLEAVFREQIQLLYERAQALAADDTSPDVALTDWMRAFLAYMTTYRGLAMTLKSMMDAAGELFTSTHKQLRWSIDTLLERAQSAGTARTDVTGSDLLRIGSGIGMTNAQAPTDEAQTERLLSLVMDGVRAR